MDPGSIASEVLNVERSRIEKILENILGEQNLLEAPVSRNEELLTQIHEMLQEKGLKATYDNGTVIISLETETR